MSKLHDLFLENYPPDENGVTEIAWIEDLIKIDNGFAPKNGCQWARKGDALDKKYIIKRFNAKDMNIKGLNWNTTVAIQLQGFKNQASIENHTIPNAVRNALKDKPCVVLGVVSSDMEIDHKDGKYSKEKYSIEDFQPMTKAVNDAKREHCKTCNSSGCRFKATTLGYPIDYIEGDENSPSCKGCYWYDPVAFRKALKKGI